MVGTSNRSVPEMAIDYLMFTVISFGMTIHGDSPSSNVAGIPDQNEGCL